MGLFFYGYQFVIRVSPNMMGDELVNHFSMDATTLGTFSSCFYLAYAMSLIIIGALMDRYGAKLFLISGLILCALSCLFFSMINNSLAACVARFFMGMGASCGFLGTLKLGTLWLPPESFSRVVALTMVLGTTGAIIGQAPLEFSKLLWMENNNAWYCNDWSLPFFFHVFYY